MLNKYVRCSRIGQYSERRSRKEMHKEQIKKNIVAKDSNLYTWRKSRQEVRPPRLDSAKDQRDAGQSRPPDPSLTFFRQVSRSEPRVFIASDRAGVIDDNRGSYKGSLGKLPLQCSSMIMKATLIQKYLITNKITTPGKSSSLKLGVCITYVYHISRI